MLGGPPSDYRTKPTDISWYVEDGAPSYDTWIGDEGAIILFFAGDEVIDKRFAASQHIPPANCFDCAIWRWRIALWRLNVVSHPKSYGTMWDK
jgi:hypothetical protein